MRRRRILAISPIKTHPSTAGNVARFRRLLETARELGHDVHLLHAPFAPHDTSEMRRYWGDRIVEVQCRRPSGRPLGLRRRLHRALGSERQYVFGIDDWYDSRLDPRITALHREHRFDTAIVLYAFMSRAFERFGPDVLKILDTQDVFTNRHRHSIEAGQTPNWFSTTARGEAKGVRRADAIVAIQDHEREFLSSISGRKVITVGHEVPLQKPRGDHVRPRRILVVGSTNPANVCSLHYFLDEIFPRIRRAVPGAECAVAGGLADRCPQRDGVTRLGPMDDLWPAYQSAAVVANPILFGTGLKIKTIEALGLGRPLVTTSSGARGLEAGSGEAFRVADSPADFAGAAIELLTLPEAARRLAERAFGFARESNRRARSEWERLLA